MINNCQYGQVLEMAAQSLGLVVETVQKQTRTHAWFGDDMHIRGHGCLLAHTVKGLAVYGQMTHFDMQYKFIIWNWAQKEFGSCFAFSSSLCCVCTSLVISWHYMNVLCTQVGGELQLRLFMLLW